MTAPRAKISASLADRGRPEMWANEQEAAVLSGYSPERFRAALPDLEKAGFPQVNAWNGLRFIPSILDFWKRQIDEPAAPVTESADQRHLENFDAMRPRQRRAS